MLTLAAAGVADASCPTLPTLQPFAEFGDLAQYELAPGGSFEGDIDGWSLGGADVDSGSLRVEPKGVAVSTALCVDARRPTWRLFARQLDGKKAQLKFEMLFTDSSGKTKVAQAGRVATKKGEYDEWLPTPVLQLGRGLPLSKSPSGTMSIRLRFTADKGGAWAVDDIYLDPYRS